MPRSFSLLLALLVPALVVGAEDRPFIDEPAYKRDDILEPEYWKEGARRLPPFPADEDLVPIPLDGRKGSLSYFIDGKHLSIGDDDVVRYTLVVRSQTGAKNVSFEGIRCDSLQYRPYAYGYRGEFKPAEPSEWQRIGNGEADRAQRELQRFYLCEPSHYRPRGREEILRSLRGQANLYDTGFIPD
jgi:hypothetical protein